MADTTSIDDLPTDPSSGNQNNVIIQKTEMNNGMRGGGGMGGGMGDGGMMNNQVMPPAQVYSPNVSGVNMMGGGVVVEWEWGCHNNNNNNKCRCLNNRNKML
jgi:hypothetical protein